eukprot:386017-Alexandrium_andersonii.AAC.1
MCALRWFRQHWGLLAFVVASWFKWVAAFCGAAELAMAKCRLRRVPLVQTRVCRFDCLRASCHSMQATKLHQTTPASGLFARVPPPPNQREGKGASFFGLPSSAAKPAEGTLDPQSSKRTSPSRRHEAARTAFFEQSGCYV